MWVPTTNMLECKNRIFYLNYYKSQTSQTLQQKHTGFYTGLSSIVPHSRYAFQKTALGSKFKPSGVQVKLLLALSHWAWLEGANGLSNQVYCCLQNKLKLPPTGFQNALPLPFFSKVSHHTLCVIQWVSWGNKNLYQLLDEARPSWNAFVSIPRTVATLKSASHRPLILINPPPRAEWT